MSIPIVKRLFNFLYLGACAASMAFQTARLMGDTKGKEGLLLLVFGIAVLGYNHFKSSIERTLAVAICAIALGANLNTLDSLLPQLLLLAVVFGGYFLLPESKSLRTRTWGKPVSIGLAWMVLTVGIPAQEHAFYLHPTLPYFYLAMERFFFILALALAYDLVDHPDDARLSLQTLPVRYGAGGTKAIAVAALVISGGFAFGNYALGFYPFVVMYRLLISLLVSVVVVLSVGRRYGAGKVVIDGMMVLQGGILYLES